MKKALKISLAINFCLVAAVFLLLVFRSPKQIIKPDYEYRIEKLRTEFSALQKDFDSLLIERKKVDTVEIEIVKWRTRVVKEIETATELELDSIIKANL